MQSCGDSCKPSQSPRAEASCSETPRTHKMRTCAIHHIMCRKGFLQHPVPSRTVTGIKQMDHMLATTLHAAGGPSLAAAASSAQGLLQLGTRHSPSPLGESSGKVVVPAERLPSTTAKLRRRSWTRGFEHRIPHFDSHLVQCVLVHAPDSCTERTICSGVLV